MRSLFWVLCCAGGVSLAAGYEIKLSTLVDKPGVEFIGWLNDSWYAIGFEKPGNLNKPPRYTIYKFTPGFRSGKASVLYPSFGEKTYYLQAGFHRGKIAMYYAVCERRTDEEWMLETRDSRKMLPVIMRQEFNAQTLEPDSAALLIFDEKDEFFTCSGIMLAQSPDGAKSALLIKPYYKHQKFKLLITDNRTGAISSKTYNFTNLKEYLQFLQLHINNEGYAYVVTRVRDDVISLAPSGKNKPQNTYYIFGVGSNGETPEPYKITSPQGGLYYRNPLGTLSTGGELVLAFDAYADEPRTVYRETALCKINASLQLTGKTTLAPKPDVAAQAAGVSGAKKGKEFTGYRSVQIITGNKGYGILAEYTDTSMQKNSPAVVSCGALLVYQTDENLALKNNWLVPKKQQSATVHYAFGARMLASPGGFYLLHNADWEADEEHFMNLMHTRLPADGGAPVTEKIVKTSDDFFVNFSYWFTGAGRIVLQQERLVDYGEISKEVRWMELTPSK
ncbi:MAG: hypothetical protein NZM35_02900 [Chitinophagales bacterium]|nr:hypothetical protein [Chitinophagales bacterium]MDW8418290.1 hypothetical protein [Chitinophagales bacterium]